ncbi:uncharacterized protein LOC144446726 [Glandiceps talaboti]
MATSQRTYGMYLIDAVMVALVVLSTICEGAPTGEVERFVSNITDKYRDLSQATRVLKTLHKEIYDNFTQLRFGDVDIGSDLTSVIVQGLPYPIGSYAVRNRTERDVLGQHRNNIQTFHAFLDVMHLEEQVRQSSGHQNSFHEEFEQMKKQLNQVVVAANSTYYDLGGEESVNATQVSNEIALLQNSRLRDQRSVIVLNRLYDYLPQANIHFIYYLNEHLGEGNTNL